MPENIEVSVEGLEEGRAHHRRRRHPPEGLDAPHRRRGPRGRDLRPGRSGRGRGDRGRVRRGCREASEEAAAE
ncbi:hypothetical protein [Microbacterium sp. NRRL B-14842]|uniref:hypothetical protein n=1 Tax=Microbacterium sp. NRRL B-14842 TaxID=3162881 RepID=UPI003D26AFC7